MIKTAGCPELCFQGSPILTFHYKKNKLSVKPIKRKIISITIIYKITHLQRNVNIWKLKGVQCHKK